jgi:DNA-binding transcriptional MerR regulator
LRHKERESSELGFKLEQAQSRMALLEQQKQKAEHRLKEQEEAEDKQRQKKQELKAQIAQMKEKM